MLRKVMTVSLIILLCSIFTMPVWAASEDGQGGGGVRFGPFTLERGNTTSGDLVVFGGPVILEEESFFDGDLTVFGEFEIDEGATLDGQLVVLGNASVSGLVDGNVFVAGPVDLNESAYVDGDLSVVGHVSQADGAIVTGEIIPIDENDWGFPINIEMPEQIVTPIIPRPDRVIIPFWLKTVTAIARGFTTVLILTLLALAAASLWPQQLERVGRTIEEEPLVSFGSGLLTLVVAVLASVLLIITICLSPFAIIGLIVVSLGVLMGWIALGLLLGRRVLSGLFNDPQPKPVLAAAVGTGLLTALIVMTQVFAALQSLLIFFLIPPVAGAVLLTRFGSIPYATRGSTPITGGSKPTAPSPAPSPKKAPLPGEPMVENQESDLAEKSYEVEIEVDEDKELETPVSETKVIDLDPE
jgi:cytoskeletal protein CcmA (bactofilin family)